jgi:hypothetical protein
MARKKSEAEVKKHLKRLLKDIGVRKEQAQKEGRGFASPSEEQLIQNITANSPHFTNHEWDALTTAGSRSSYLANYEHTDSGAHLLFVTIFFGLAVLDPDISSAIRARDTRWPYVSSEVFILNPGETGVAHFDFTVPYVTKGTYFINAVLWEGILGQDGVGTLFDREGPFSLTVK